MSNNNSTVNSTTITSTGATSNKHVVPTKTPEQSNAEVLKNAFVASAKGEDFGDALLKGMLADLAAQGRPLTYSELRDRFG